MDDDEARRLLHAERERLEGLLAAARDATSEQADDDPATSDEPKHITDRQLEQSELERVRAQLAEVDAALGRVDDGTYGASEVSGEPIPDERLRAVPWTRRLVEEQELADNQGRASTVSNPDLSRDVM